MRFICQCSKIFFIQWHGAIHTRIPTASLPWSRWFNIWGFSSPAATWPWLLQLKFQGVMVSWSSFDISKTYVEQRINDQVRIPGQFLHKEKQDLPWTNNSLEGWLCGLAKIFMSTLDWLCCQQNCKINSITYELTTSTISQRGKNQRAGRNFLSTFLGRCS